MVTVDCSSTIVVEEELTRAVCHQPRHDPVGATLPCPCNDPAVVLMRIGGEEEEEEDATSSDIVKAKGPLLLLLLLLLESQGSLRSIGDCL